MSTASFTEEQLNDLILNETIAFLAESGVIQEGSMDDVVQYFKTNRDSITTFVTILSLTGILDRTFKKNYLDDALFLGLAAWDASEGDYVGMFLNFLGASKTVGPAAKTFRILFLLNRGRGLGAAWKNFGPAYTMVKAARNEIKDLTKITDGALRAFKRRAYPGGYSNQELRNLEKFFKSGNEADALLLSQARNAGINSVDDFIQYGAGLNRFFALKYESWLISRLPIITNVVLESVLFLDAAFSPDPDYLFRVLPLGKDTDGDGQIDKGLSEEDIREIARKLNNMEVREYYNILNEIIRDTIVSGLKTSAETFATQFMKFLRLTDPSTPGPRDKQLRRFYRREDVVTAYKGQEPATEFRTFRELSDVMGYRQFGGPDGLRTDLGFETQQQIDDWLEEGREKGYFVIPMQHQRRMRRVKKAATDKGDEK